MRTITRFCCILCLLLCISLVSRAQTNKAYRPFELPVDTGFAKKQFLQSFARYNMTPAMDFPKKIGGSELFDYYQLPQDKMTCVVPTSTVKGQILVYGQVAGNTVNNTIDTDELLLQKRYRSMDKWSLMTP